jgi:probable HAF family extracellular repeat protein
MTCKRLSCLTALICASSAWGQGRTHAQQQFTPKHHHYKLVVLGPLGGPNSGTGGEITAYGVINNSGATLISADTPVLDPFNLGFNIFHSYKWQNGTQTDLETLPTQSGSVGNNTYPNWINEWGLTAGWSATGVLDPITGAPETHAVIWTPEGEIFDLGTLGGYQSQANAVNDFGQATGWVENTTPDPFSFGEGAETQAFIWQFGVMRRLGTLGGPDSNAFFINDLGQAAGCSLTNSTPNAATGFPTFDAFIWENGKMIDLNPGNFGGTQGCANFLNNRGQVVGFMDTAGDVHDHPFLWNQGKITDLFAEGNLGGANGSAMAVSEAGHVAGNAELPIQGQHHAVLWRDGGIIDLQTVDGDPCSLAFFLNSSDQVVGTSGACDESTAHAFLWESGEIVDLNALVPSSSGIQLQFALSINESGVIAGNGILNNNGDNRAFLLIPCDSNHTGLEDCDYSPVGSVASLQVHPRQTTGAAETTARQTILSPTQERGRSLSIILSRRHRFGFVDNK